MNLILEVNLKKKLEQNDILVFDGKQWTNESKDEFLAKANAELKELDERVEKLEKQVAVLSQLVKELRGED